MTRKAIDGVKQIVENVIVHFKVYGGCSYSGLKTAEKAMGVSAN